MRRLRPRRGHDRERRLHHKAAGARIHHADGAQGEQRHRLHRIAQLSRIVHVLRGERPDQCLMQGAEQCGRGQVCVLRRQMTGANRCIDTAGDFIDDRAAACQARGRYIDIDGLCPRCGNFRRRTRDRSCYACHLARSGANFERMKAGLAPIVSRSKDGHVDLVKRQKADREDEFNTRQFGDFSAKLWPMGRLEVTFPDGYVEPDMTKLSWRACMNALEMYPGLRDVLRWAGWSVD